MPEEFCSLVTWLQQRNTSPPPADTVADRIAVAPPETSVETLESLREARLFRAKLADALDVAVAALLHAIATDVVAREMQLAPCDVRAIAERAAESANVPIACVRVHADDAAAFEGSGFTVYCASGLRRGDLCVSLEGGELDATLAVRLNAAVLRALS